MSVRLDTYNNKWYRPGRSTVWQVGWFLLGLPLLRSSLLPSSVFRTRLLRLFGAQVGKDVVIKPGVRVKYPWHLHVGDYSWLGEDCWIDNLTTVQIGNHVCVSQGVYFCTGNHDWTDPSFGLMVKPVILHDGAWAGAKAVLMPGVVLGQNAIASAGAVVVRNIPANEIHAGNPAVFTKRRLIRETEIQNEYSRPNRVAS